MIGAIILALCAGGALAFVPLFKQRSAVALRIEQLRADVTKKKNEFAQRQREVELLKTDSEYVETVARDRLDLMKPGETIVRIEPARSPAPARSGSPRN